MIAVLLSLLGAVGAVLAATMLALFAARLSGSRMRPASFLLSAVLGAAVVTLCWATGVTGVPAPFLAPVIGLGVFFATAVTVPQRAAGHGLVRTGVFAALVTALVFVPGVILVWALWYDPFVTGIGYLDFGAALPAGVAAGSAVLAVLLLERHRTAVQQSPSRGWSIFWPMLLLWAGWIGLLVSLELSIDRLTPTILANALIMPVAGAVAVSLVERARERTNSFTGVALGFLAGSVAATASAGYVIPLLGALIGLLAGAFSSLLPRIPLTRLAGTLLVPGGVSLVFLGFLAKDVGFIYTGQPELLFNQALTVVLGAAVGFVLALAAWSVVRIGRH